MKNNIRKANLISSNLVTYFPVLNEFDVKHNCFLNPVTTYYFFYVMVAKYIYYPHRKKEILFFTYRLRYHYRRLTTRNYLRCLGKYLKGCEDITWSLYTFLLQFQYDIKILYDVITKGHKELR